MVMTTDNSAALKGKAMGESVKVKMAVGNRAVGGKRREVGEVIDLSSNEARIFIAKKWAHPYEESKTVTRKKARKKASK